MSERLLENSVLLMILLGEGNRMTHLVKLIARMMFHNPSDHDSMVDASSGLDRIDEEVSELEKPRTHHILLSTPYVTALPSFFPVPGTYDVVLRILRIPIVACNDRTRNLHHERWQDFFYSERRGI